MSERCEQTSKQTSEYRGSRLFWTIVNGVFLLRGKDDSRVGLAEGERDSLPNNLQICTLTDTIFPVI